MFKKIQMTKFKFQIKLKVQSRLNRDDLTFELWILDL